MLNLIRKDFFTIGRKELLFLLGYMGIALSFAGKLTNESTYLIVIITLTYILSTSNFSYDEKNNSHNFINSLPLTRSEVVISKYIVLFLYTALIITVISLLGALITTLNLPRNIGYIKLATIKHSIFSILLMNSISYPLYFKLDIKKGQTFNVIMYLTFTMIIFNISSLNNSTALKNIILFAKDNPSIVGFSLSAFIIVLTAASTILSITFYERREF